MSWFSRVWERCMKCTDDLCTESDGIPIDKDYQLTGGMYLPYPILMLVGGPGSGKKTLAKGLRQCFNVEYTSVQATMKYVLKLETPKERMNRALRELYRTSPNPVIEELHQIHIDIDLANTDYSGFIIIGFFSAYTTRATLERKFGPISKVIFLDTSEENMKMRTFAKQTNINNKKPKKPFRKSLKKFKKLIPKCQRDFKDVMVTVDGNKTAEEVLATCKELLASVFPDPVPYPGPRDKGPPKGDTHIYKFQFPLNIEPEEDGIIVIIPVDEADEAFFRND